MNWLLIQEIFIRLQAFANSNYNPSAAQVEAFTAPGSGIGSIVGTTGIVKVEGVLTEKPDFFAFLFGGGNTTYQAISEQLLAFEADSSVKDIRMDFSSGGGTVAGMFETFAVMDSITKTITGRVGSMAASAAFGLLSQTDKIEATSPASAVGSVGVVMSFLVEDDVIDITSKEAPNKRPDVTTEEGKKVVQAHLDDIHALFAGAIARGRGTTVANVNATFGRGSIVLAEQAIKLGMIDCICEGAFNIDSTKAKLIQKDSDNMTAAELREKYPDLYKAIVAEGHATGVEAGIKSERDRVSAHLTYGQKGKCMDIAVKAVKEGTEVTQTLQAEYLTAAQDVTANDTRGEGDADVAAALEAAKIKAGETDAVDVATAALYTEKFGDDK